MSYGKKGLRIRIIFILALCCCAFVGCGRGAVERQQEYYEVQSKLQPLFEAQEDREEIFLGMQYYQGEPVQLWTQEGNGLCLIKEDWSQETILDHVDTAGAMEWFLDGEGGIYCWKRDWALGKKEDTVLRKLNSSGEEVHSWALEEKMTPEDICRLQDGRIVLLLRDRENGSGRLGVLEPDRDAVSLLEDIRLEMSPYRQYITAGEEGLLVLDTDIHEGISEIDMTDGSRLRTIAYSGTPGKNSSVAEPEGMEIEGMEIKDFRMSEKGDIQILWADQISGKASCEQLLLTKIEKEFIRLRAYVVNGWLQEKIVEFNHSDPEYYIITEELPQGTARRDYATQTSVKLAAGKGPDILYGEILHTDGFQGMVEKGIFEDLAPLLEQSGINEEDYFPFTFQYWRDGGRIYTVCATGYPYYFYVNNALLEIAEEPNIKTLVEALLSYPEEAYFELMLEDDILNFFLRGSEDFWGMIDWEKENCDFNNELFAGMLEAARRYSCKVGEIVSVPERPFLAGIRSCENLYYFDSSEEMEKQGRIMAGVQFDDGCHAVIMASQFAIVHGASSKKEGAWRFLSYLLQEDTQLTIRKRESGYWGEVPSNREALVGIIQEDLAWMAENDGKKFVDNGIKFPSGEELIRKQREYTREDITEDRIAEYVELVEDARALSTAMDPLLDIIYEEAKYYLNGVKSFEETAEVINNRVGLYIKEK